MEGVITGRLGRAETATAVAGELNRFLELRSGQAAAYGASFEALWAEAAACVLGGKLVRPRLLIELFEALTDAETLDAEPAPRASLVRIAAAVELLHYSFLLHDDVIDGDLTRRHRPNLIGALLHRTSTSLNRVDTLRWARTGGILMGDLMLTAALQSFARERLPATMHVRLLDLLDRTITESVAGEHLDVGLSDGIVPAELDTVLSMSRLKTATYTFELPLRAAAILAGASDEMEGVIGDAGRHLGLAFQLQDDLLSTFGAPEEHGKDPFSDLREGKETAIIAFARTTTAWPAIEPLLSDFAAGEGDGRVLQTMLAHCGAEDYARSLMEQQTRAGLDTLSDAAGLVPPPVVHFFAELVASLEGRRA